MPARGWRRCATARTRPELIERYRLPRPRLEAGERLAPLVSRDDGRLRRPAARRQADGGGQRMRARRSSSTRSRCPKPISRRGARRGSRRRRPATIMSCSSPRAPTPRPTVLALAEEIGLPFSRIGRFEAGAGLALTERGSAHPAARKARLRAWLKPALFPPKGRATQARPFAAIAPICPVQGKDVFP